MTRAEAINYLTSTGLTEEQVMEVVEALEQEPCEDAISRQAVLSMQYRIDDSATLSTRDVVNVDDIEDLPSVIPQSKTGHWEWVRYDSNPNIGNWHCSECNMIVCGAITAANPVYAYNYCPNCGAKMVEPQESEGKK